MPRAILVCLFLAVQCPWQSSAAQQPTRAPAPVVGCPPAASSLPAVPEASAGEPSIAFIISDSQLAEKKQDAPERTHADDEREARHAVSKAMRDAASEMRKAGVSPDVQEIVRNAMPWSQLDQMPGFAHIMAFNETRVNADVDDGCALTALNDIFKRARQKCGFDADLPQDKRITLHIKNVRLATLVDLITQSAGIGWRLDARRDAETGKIVTFYHIVREPLPIVANVHTGPTIGPNLFTNVTSPPGAPYVAQAMSGSGVAFSFRVPEERSSFTCPHCKRRIVTIRGAKAAPWKFCPVCGARLELEAPDEPEDVIQPGQQLDVKIVLDGRDSDFSGTYSVSPSGNIVIKPIGQIRVIKLTSERACEIIKSRLCARDRSAKVKVEVVSR